MAQLILVVIAVEKAMRAEHHEYHCLWAAGKLIKCARMAGVLGYLSWE